MITPAENRCLLASNTEALASQRASDSCYGSAENIGVLAVVILELGFQIPLDMSNSESLALAIKAVEGIKAAMPAGSVVEVAGTLGKV